MSTSFRFSHLLAEVPHPVITVDRACRVADLNLDAERLFGYRSSEAIGRPITDLVDDLSPVREGDGGPVTAPGARGPAGAARREYTARHADGTRFRIELTLIGPVGDEGHVTGWVRPLESPESPESPEAPAPELAFCQQALALTEELAAVASWEWDAATGRLSWSENARRMLGVDDDQNGNRETIKSLLDRLQPSVREVLVDVLRRVRRDHEARVLDAQITGADGRLRQMEISARYATGADGKASRVIGAIRDVTDERLSRRGIEARLAVSRELREWRGLPGLLEVLAGALGCEAATLWVPDDGDVLVPRVGWTSSALHGSGFERENSQLRLPKGVGLPGSAWERRQPVDLATLTTGRSEVSQGIFDRAGLQAAVAFPVLGDDVIGVIDLDWRDPLAITDPELAALAGMGYEVGGFLRRRRAELHSNPLTPRELEVLRLAADGLGAPEIASRLVVKPSTVKSHFDNIYTKLGVTGRVAATAVALRQGLID